MKGKRSGALVLATITTLAGVAQAGDVWVVSESSVLTLDDAIEQSSDGDIVLLAPGGYPGFTIDAKSLVVVADGAGVVIEGSVAVHSLGESQFVALQGLSIRGASNDAAIRATVNHGPVWIEDCQVEASDSSAAEGNPGIQIVQCESVVIRQTGAVGGFGGYEFGYEGGAAVLIRDSNASVLSGRFEGGGGGWGGTLFGGCDGDDGEKGGAGIFIENSAVQLQAVDSSGGRGGEGDYCSDGSPALCGPGGPGGSGLVFAGTSAITAVDVQLFGGGGGSAPSGAACSDGADGVPVESLGVSPATIVEATPVTLRGTSPMREGEIAEWTTAGEPGSLIALYASFDPGAGSYPSLFGSALLAPSPTLVGVYVVPPTGSLTLLYPVPDLGAIEGQYLAMQAVGILASGAIAFGESGSVVLLDGSF